MKNVIGFCNLHDNPSLGALTEKRPIGAISFLGRYGLMDFSLSNFTNSEIDRIYVLVESRLAAIRKHVGNGQIWIRNTKLGHVDLQLNEKEVGNSRFNTDISNINQTMDIEDIDFDYAVFSYSCYLASMDLRPIIDKHVDSKADITLVYKPCANYRADGFDNCDLFDVDEKDNVTNSYKDNNVKKANVSIGVFVISRKVLLQILEEGKNVSSLFSLRDMINFYITSKKFKIKGYKFNDFVFPILSYEHYVENSFKLLDYHTRCKLFKPDWPIYTTSHNTPPTFYGKKCDVKNSFIANGSQVRGKVENSIISRDVVIDEGAVVKNSIIFTKSEVGPGVHVEYVLADKKVKFTRKVKGTEKEVIYVKGGSII